MRPKVQTLLYVLLRGTWLVVGICLGAVAVMMIDSGAELALDRSLAWGIAIGAGLCVLAAFILIMLRPKEMDAPLPMADADLTETRAAFAKVTDRLGLTEIESNQLANLAKQQFKSVLALGLRLWSGAAALGMAAAVAGSVIAMVTAFAAIRQVSRIDAQNALLEQQIFEAQANRAASVLAAQLPSLLAAIDAERMAHVSGLQADQAGQRNKRLWVPSDSLRARIQAAIDLAEPYERDAEVDAAVIAMNADLPERNAGFQGEAGQVFRASSLPEMRFSPQRAQIFRLLVAAEMDFGGTDPPLDFSASDFRGVNLRGTSEVRILNVGRTILRNSNFLGGDLDHVYLAQADLRGAILQDIAQTAKARTFHQMNTDFDAFARNTWALLEDVLILRQPDPDLAIRRGWIGNTTALAVGGRRFWSGQDTEQPFERMRRTEGPGPSNFLVYHNLRQDVVVGDRRVFRMGTAPYFTRVSTMLFRDLFAIATRWNHATQIAWTNSGTLDCARMAGPAFDEMHNFVWFAGQPEAHSKWRNMLTAMDFDALRAVLDCFSGEIAEPRPPKIVQEVSLLSR